MSNASPDNLTPQSDKSNTVAHTPGPWTVPHFAEPDVNCQCEYVLCDSHTGAICAVYASGKGDDFTKHGDNPKFAQAAANARLIAAAPDLLEVLKHVDYLLNELADERTPANVEMTPAEAALVAFRKHTRSAIQRAGSEQ